MEPVTRCLPCEQAKRNPFVAQKLELITRLSKIFKDEDFKTVAIVKTKNGFPGCREIGDESLSRLEVVEYISFVQGTPVGQIYRNI